MKTSIEGHVYNTLTSMKLGEYVRQDGCIEILYRSRREKLFVYLKNEPIIKDVIQRNRIVLISVEAARRWAKLYSPSSLDAINHNGTETLTLRIDGDKKLKLSQIAITKKISINALINLWISQKLNE